ASQRSVAHRHGSDRRDPVARTAQKCRRRSGARGLGEFPVMLPADVFYPGTKSTDDPKCPLPALICIATVSLCAKPEIDSFAHDRRVGRLATCGDAAYRGGLLPRQLPLVPLPFDILLRVKGPMRALPLGTVTFLFTDIEGSTRLLQDLGERYAQTLADHRRVVRSALAEHGGVEVDTQGDAFFAAFADASDAVAAARSVQCALASSPVRVRMGIPPGARVVTDGGELAHRASAGACGAR